MRESVSGDGEPLLAFVHINKTAGSTMKFVLRNTFCLRHCNLFPKRYPADDDDLAFARRVYRFGLQCVSGHGLVGPSERIRTPLLRFTILRDPRERCLSHFLHRKRGAALKGRTLRFVEFLEDPEMWDRQTRTIAGAPDLERAKQELEEYFFVGLTERFEESLLAFARLSPLPIRREYVRRHVTPNRGDRAEVLEDTHASRLLQQANELDQQLYDHVRDHVYPRLLEEAVSRSQPLDAEFVERKTLTLRFLINRWFHAGVYRLLVLRRRRSARFRGYPDP